MFLMLSIYSTCSGNFEVARGSAMRGTQDNSITGVDGDGDNGVEGGRRRECRICKIGEDDSRSLGDLIEPGGCAGSMRSVHTKC